MRMNLKKWLGVVAAAAIFMGGTLPRAFSQTIPCNTAVINAIKQQGLQKDILKTAGILQQLDETGALAQKFGGILNDLVASNVAGAAGVPADALSQMLKLPQNYANPAVFSNTSSSLQAMQEAIEGIDTMRQQFGHIPEGIFNRPPGDSSSSWLSTAYQANSRGQAFEIKGYLNLRNQGVLPATEPVFGTRFDTSAGVLECDVLVGATCVDFKFTSDAHFTLDGPDNAVAAIEEQEVDQVFYAVSPSASAAPSSFQSAVAQAAAAAGFAPNTLTIIDAGTF